MCDPRRTLAALGGIVAAVAAAVVLADPPGEPSPGRPARVLMVTASRTFTHDSVKRDKQRLSPAEIAVTQLGQQSGLFRVDCTQDPARDFTKENLDKYDLVFFYTQGPDLDISREALDYFFDEWLKKKGHGFVGTHSAADTYAEYEPYRDMIGGSFDGHPWNADQTVTITVHDTKHPASRVWGNEFTIRDEIYQYKHWKPEKARVLMSLNMAQCQVKQPRHVPVAWVKTFGDGRIFYTNLGHNVETWSNRTFLDSLLGGIRWVLRVEEGDATPNPEVSQAEEAKAKAAADGS